MSQDTTRHIQLRAIVLAALMVTSIVAAVPIGMQPVAAEDTDEPENFEFTGETYHVSEGEAWPASFAEYGDHLYVGGGFDQQVHRLDSDLETVETYDLSHQPTGLARFNDEWVVASEDSGGLYAYDDNFQNPEQVVDTDVVSDSSTAPWNLGTDGESLYVADGSDVIVLDSDYAEVDRFETGLETVKPLEVVDGTIYAADPDTDEIAELSTDGDLLETYTVDWEFAESDDRVYGFGVYDGHWYAGNNGLDEDIYEYHYFGASTSELSGQVVDQSGAGVGEATVVAWGVREANLEGTDPDDLQAEAEGLLDDLEDPLPDDWNPEYDLDSHLESDGTYVLAHESQDWGVGTNTIIDSALEDPRVTVSSDREVVLSMWDPDEGGGWIDNQVDQSFPGAAVSGTIVVEQLGPTGETTSRMDLETDTVARTTGANPLTTNDHPGVRTTLPEGIYRVYPEGNEAGGYVLAVGDPDAIASAIADDLRDEADDLTARADRVQSLLADETVVRETTRTDADGNFGLEIDDGVSVVSVEAMKVDGETLEDVTDPSIDDVREARLEDYNGAVYLPAGGERVEPPAEDVTLEVYKSPEVPFEDLERFADLLEELEAAFLDGDLSELDGWDELVSEIDEDRLEDLHGELSELADENEQLRERVDELLEREFDPGESPEGVDELREELEALQQAVDGLEDSLEVGPGDGEVDDGVASVAVPIDGVFDADAVAVLAHTPDGETHSVDREYWSLEREGWLSDEREVVVEDYPIGDGLEAVEFEVVVAGEDSGSVSVPVGDADLASFDALQVSTLTPGPDERVSVGVDPGPDGTVAGLAGVDVFDPDGEAVGVTLEDGEARFETDGAGVYHVRVTLEGPDGEVVVSERVRAGEVAYADPTTIRLSSSAVGEYAVVSGDLESARVDGGESVDVTAVVGDDVPPGEVHLQPGGVLEGVDYEIGLEVVRGYDESEVRSNIAVAVHFDEYPDDALAWRDGAAVTRDGSTRFGEVRERDSRHILYTFTDERGSVALEIEGDPGLLDEFWHWADYSLPVLTVHAPVAEKTVD